MALLLHGVLSFLEVLEGLSAVQVCPGACSIHRVRLGSVGNTKSVRGCIEQGAEMGVTATDLWANR